MTLSLLRSRQAHVRSGLAPCSYSLFLVTCSGLIYSSTSLARSLAHTLVARGCSPHGLMNAITLNNTHGLSRTTMTDIAGPLRS